MQDYEKLGVFFLGHKYDMAAKQRSNEAILYDSRDLVTHGVCVGMTGSGKTGLCIGLLEEAAIDGIPALIIDPKGDLPNLLLTFPDLRPEDFRPWIEEEAAARKGLSGDEFAKQQAELWKKGLADWGQDGERIRRLRNAADFTVYTPGSQAGRPLSILKSFAAPPAAILADADLRHERISTTVTSLLGLLGLDADPIQSREHILLSNVLDHAWSQARNVDLGSLILMIQEPPLTRIGVMDLESFYPSKQRFELAMRLNNLLAAPGFQGWLEGEPLDVQRMLYTPEGKPRVSIFSIAHLSDAERMFFVSLLLNEALGWMRMQSGTSSLRALLYMDEIAGYLPPVAAPPSKAPLLTLLKQARAYGFGVVLSTQNPVDLDYKALSNAGTWFIGRLQTDQDVERLLDGLDSAGGGGLHRKELGELISELGKRVFLLHNVHEEEPVLFQTRWVMSYLRGPMTREELKRLTQQSSPQVASGAVAVPSTTSAGVSAVAKRTGLAHPPQTPAPAQNLATTRPLLPPKIPACALPVTGVSPPGAALLYRPMLLGSVSIDYLNAKHKIDVRRQHVRLTDFTSSIDWDDGDDIDISDEEIVAEPRDAASFEDPHPSASDAKLYAKESRSLCDWVYRNMPLEIFRSATLKETSRPGESEGDFRVRLRDVAREQRDLQNERLRAKYAPKLARLQDRIHRAEQVVQRESEQAKGQKTQTLISFGTALLGSFLGRKRMTASTLGRATTAARGVQRSHKEARDVDRAKTNLQRAQEELAALETAFEEEIAGLEGAFQVEDETFEVISIRPKKINIAIERLALAWVPSWQHSDGRLAPAWTPRTPGASFSQTP